MEAKSANPIDSIPHKGGIIGALLGALASLPFLKKKDKTWKNAGKTILFSGSGFLLGEWMEKQLKKK